MSTDEEKPDGENPKKKKGWETEDEFGSLSQFFKAQLDGSEDEKKEEPKTEPAPPEPKPETSVPEQTPEAAPEDEGESIDMSPEAFAKMFPDMAKLTETEKPRQPEEDKTTLIIMPGDIEEGLVPENVIEKMKAGEPALVVPVGQLAETPAKKNDLGTVLMSDTDNRMFQEGETHPTITIPSESTAEDAANIDSGLIKTVIEPTEPIDPVYGPIQEKDEIETPQNPTDSRLAKTLIEPTEPIDPVYSPIQIRDGIEVAPNQAGAPADGTSSQILEGIIDDTAAQSEVEKQLAGLPTKKREISSNPTLQVMMAEDAKEMLRAIAKGDSKDITAIFNAAEFIAYSPSKEAPWAGTHFVDIKEPKKDKDGKPDEKAPKQEYRFELIRLLGAGGMGSVYLAKSVTKCGKCRPGTLVALKFSETGVGAGSMDPSFERLKQEAIITEQVKHPNFVGYLAKGEIVKAHPLQKKSDGSKIEKDICYLAMEYIPHRTLEDRIKHEGRLSIDEVMHVIEQLANAMHDGFHAQGLIHRDLKPENICSTTDFSIKILDFGLARNVDPSKNKIQTVGYVVGTPFYMPPEQVRGERPNEMNDVFNIGAIAMALLTEKPPYAYIASITMNAGGSDTNVNTVKNIARSTKSPRIRDIEEFVRNAHPIAEPGYCETVRDGKVYRKIMPDFDPWVDGMFAATHAAVKEERYTIPELVYMIKRIKKSRTKTKVERRKEVEKAQDLLVQFGKGEYKKDFSKALNVVNRAAQSMFYCEGALRKELMDHAKAAADVVEKYIDSQKMGAGIKARIDMRVAVIKKDQFLYDERSLLHVMAGEYPALLKHKMYCINHSLDSVADKIRAPEFVCDQAMTPFTIAQEAMERVDGYFEKMQEQVSETTITEKGVVDLDTIRKGLAAKVERMEKYVYGRIYQRAAQKIKGSDYSTAFGWLGLIKERVEEEYSLPTRDGGKVVISKRAIEENMKIAALEMQLVRNEAEASQDFMQDPDVQEASQTLIRLYRQFGHEGYVERAQSISGVLVPAIELKLAKREVKLGQGYQQDEGVQETSIKLCVLYNTLGKDEYVPKAEQIGNWLVPALEARLAKMEQELGPEYLQDKGVQETSRNLCALYNALGKDEYLEKAKRIEDLFSQAANEPKKDGDGSNGAAPTAPEAPAPAN